MSIKPNKVAKLKPKVKAMWLTELRRDDLKQGQQFLCQLTHGVYQFCCWGLVMELYQHHNPDTQMIESLSPEKHYHAYPRVYTYRSSLLNREQSDTEPISKVLEWAFEPWDRTENDNGECIGFIPVGDTVNWLIHMNDGLRKSFREIANWIEENL